MAKRDTVSAMTSRNTIIPRDARCSNVREIAGLRKATQADIGIITGLAQPTVSMKLSGERRWKVSELTALADAWGLALDELTGRSTNR